MEPKFLTEKEVSQITGLSLSTLRTHRVKMKGIPFVKMGEKLVRYEYADVMSFIAKGKIATKTDCETATSKGFLLP